MGIERRNHAGDRAFDAHATWREPDGANTAVGAEIWYAMGQGLDVAMEVRHEGTSLPPRGYCAVRMERDGLQALPPICFPKVGLNAKHLNERRSLPPCLPEPWLKWNNFTQRRASPQAQSRNIEPLPMHGRAGVNRGSDPAWISLELIIAR